MALARALKGCGVDVVDCSSGRFVAIAPYRPWRAYQASFAETVRREADIATMAVGLITEARQTETILHHDQADLIAMARELMARADSPVVAARDLDVADHLDLYPPSLSHRLKQRNKTVHANVQLADDLPALLELIEKT